MRVTRILITMCCALAIATMLMVTGARADEYTKQTFLTFSGPVQVPGMTLPAGTYMFKLADPQKTAAQLKLASDIMDPGFQSAFNVVKGSAPARFDVSDAAFDDCGKKAIKDAAEANKNNTLVGSIAHGHAVPASIKNAFYDVITRHFNGQIDDKKAVAELASAAKS